MRRFTPLVFCAVILAGSIAIQSQSDPNAAVVYEGARLIVGNGSAAIENGAFVVRAGLIDAIGPKGSVTVPAGANHVDLTGKTVMPTLINMHVHPGYEGSPFNNYFAWSPENWTPQNVQVHMQREAFYGVSVALSAGGDLTSRALSFAQDQMDGNLEPAARYIYAGGLLLPNGGPDAVLAKANAALGTLYKASTVQEARAAVQQLAEKKVRNLKVWIDRRGETYPKMTPDTYQVYAAVYDEAHKHQMVVQTHARLLDDQKAAVRGGTDVLVHTTQEPIDDEYVALLKEKKPYWTPVDGTGIDPAEACKDPFVNQGVIESALDATNNPVTGAVGTDGCNSIPIVAANEDKMAATFKKMLESGARLVLGTDAGIGRYMFGWAEHYDMARYVKFGLTPAQAIQAGTERPAELLGLKDAGTLAVGKRADFIVLNANPLDDIRNTRQIASVYLRGNKLDRDGLLGQWSRTKARRR